MFITYLRSSSYNNYDFCQQQYFIDYVLGYKHPSNKAAEKGTIVHKVMEVLGEMKKAQQNGETTIDDHICGKLNVADINSPGLVNNVFWKSYNYFMSISKHTFYPKDFKECKEWVWMALDFNNGAYDVRKLKVVDTEKSFDIEVPYDWAKYDYEINGKRLTGQLHIKGTIDLVTESKPGVLTVIDYKGLPLDTPIPTVDGWSTMGDLKIGDIIFDENGQQTKVTGKSEIKLKECYKITFDDTSEVIADEEHLWKLDNGKIVNTCNLKLKDKINIAKPINTKDIELPIDPYVLGNWLGNGRCKRGEISSPDIFVFNEIEKRGYKIGTNSGRKNKICQQRTPIGLITKLKNINLVDNKHIPKIYLRASVEQRIDLLRGLLDSDGSVNTIRKQAVFSNCNKKLSDDIKELIISLGQRPNQCDVNSYGFGKRVKSYPVVFRPIDKLNPFLLPRKANGRSDKRKIAKIEAVGLKFTQCIMVDSPTHTYLCTKNMIPTHNTGQRKNWGTDEVKDYDDFEKDPQLKIYNYAIQHLYPNAKSIMFTIFWIRDGGPFTVCFEKNLKDVEQMLEKRFNDVKANIMPFPNKGKRCNYCKFKKPSEQDPTQSMCDYIHNLVIQKGMDKVVKEHSNPGHNIDQYHSPGSA